MDEGKFLAALQHIVGAVHQLAVSSASGLPHVVAMANSAQALLNDLMPQPEPPMPEHPEPAPPAAPEPAPEADPINQMNITARGPDEPTDHGV